MTERLRDPALPAATRVRLYALALQAQRRVETAAPRREPSAWAARLRAQRTGAQRESA